MRVAIGLSDEHKLIRYLKLWMVPSVIRNSTIPPDSSLPRFADGKVMSITPGNIGITLDPMKRCIYCGATEYKRGKKQPLGAEHVVSDALGGNLLLPEASCEECERHTSGVESAVLNELFWVPRHKLRLRGRTRKREHLAFAFTTQVDEKDVTIHLPLEKHPAALLMPILHEATLGQQGRANNKGVSGLWANFLNNPSLANTTEVWTPALDSLKFCQLIAKIGHSFAIASLGLDSFVPELPNLIRRKFKRTDSFPSCYDLVGGRHQFYAPGAALHEIALAVTPRDNAWIVSTHVRLFANYGAPVYVAAAGKLIPGLTFDQALARGPLSRALPKRNIR